ncbi:carbohydrate kinase family protein [Fictibacillus sp. B-59209]|uniref:carbohydrate kinase family protein n=1 Tax=Fictibacillus sp. B-59209 TaxID=3024873 RepID=UPI002E1E6DF5|nr:carbohydrate kinase family protein [Fictibacillus sp. B-59209]
MTQKSQILIFGGIIVDQYVIVDHSPDRGGDVLISDSFFRVGGCAINVGTTLKNLGIQPHIVSNVGDDTWGRKIKDYLDLHHFSREAIRFADDKKSGYCISIVEYDGERTFLTYKGCESQFSRVMISRELCESVSYVYVTGYYLLVPEYAHNVVHQLTDLKQAGAQLVFDPGPLAALIEDEVLHSVLKLTDLLIPNLTELDILERKLKWDNMEISRFIETGIRNVVLKKGSKGAEVWTEDTYFKASPFAVNSVDTTGAGDSFAGGLLYGLSKGYDMKTSVKIASACGAITTTIMGPHGEFTVGDVTGMIEKEG